MNDKENQRKTKGIAETQMTTNEKKHENHRKNDSKTKETQENRRITHENY
jgi:hypothetical protein